MEVRLSILGGGKTCSKTISGQESDFCTSVASVDSAEGRILVSKKEMFWNMCLI